LQVPFVEAATRAAQRITLASGSTIELKLPAGVEQGQQMRLAGKGEPGPGGPGDALVTIEIAPHPFFVREGDNIRLDLPITLEEAVNGAKVKVPTVDGAVMLTVAPGSSSGRTLRLKGKGFTRKDGERGDQLVTLQIDLPPMMPISRPGWPAGPTAAIRAHAWAFKPRCGRTGPKGREPSGAFVHCPADGDDASDPDLAAGVPGVPDGARHWCPIFPRSAPPRGAQPPYAPDWAKCWAMPAPIWGRAPVFELLKRVWTGVINDGFIHAGNFAYMVLIALFPFFITGAALFSLIGETSQRTAAINTVLMALPPVVATTIEPVARAAVEARTGHLLWIGGLVGLWTVSSLVETIRDILRRAYGTRWEHAFWRYRLMSTGLIIASVVLILVSIMAQVAIGAAQEVIAAWMPQFGAWVDGLAASRFLPTLVLFGALWLLFLSLTPAPIANRYPKWPGALFVCLWWLGVSILLPKLLASVFSYDLTYGSLAGVMIALFFFWLVGIGMV
jgi:membrane protein